MRKIIWGAGLYLVAVGAAFATDKSIDAYDCECDCGGHNDGIFFVSMGMDIGTDMRNRIKIGDVRTDINWRDKYNWPNVSGGLDIAHFVLGVNATWYNDANAHIRVIGAHTEIPILPFEISPYVIGEIGTAEIRYHDDIIRVHDWSLVYGGGWGIRFDVASNTFVKLYQIWSRYHFTDDTDLRIRNRMRRIGFSIGYVF